MDVALNVDVVLLDIGRLSQIHFPPFPLFYIFHLPVKIPEYLPTLYVTCMAVNLSLLYLPTYLWSADSDEAEGTVCPISFVKDVLVRTPTGRSIPPFHPPSLPFFSRVLVGNHQIMGFFKVFPRRTLESISDTRITPDQTLVLASAVAILMYRCKRPKREEEASISASHVSPPTAQVFRDCSHHIKRS